MMGNHKRHPSQLSSPVLPVRKKQYQQMTTAQAARANMEACLGAPKDMWFTKVDAITLSLEINAFKEAYQREGYAPPSNASNKEIEMANFRRNIFLRSRKVEQALHNTFDDVRTRVDELGADHPVNTLLRRYQTDLAISNADWETHVLPLQRHREAKQSWRDRRSGLADFEQTSTDDWWKASREEEEDDDVEKQYLADDEADGDIRGRRRAACEKKVRVSWYALRKQDNRRRGIRITRDNPGPIREWEQPDFVRDATPPGVRARSDWVIPDHVQTHADLDVYLNQLGLRKTEVPQSLLM